jgi:hypothetical protein
MISISALPFNFQFQSSNKKNVIREKLFNLTFRLIFFVDQVSLSAFCNDCEMMMRLLFGMCGELVKNTPMVGKKIGKRS